MVGERDGPVLIELDGEAAAPSPADALPVAEPEAAPDTHEELYLKGQRENRRIVSGVIEDLEKMIAEVQELLADRKRELARIDASINWIDINEPIVPRVTVSYVEPEDDLCSS